MEAVVVKAERGGLRQGKQRVRRRDQLTPVRAERAGRVVGRTVVVQDRAGQGRRERERADR